MSDHVCVELWVLDTGFTEQFSKFAARLAAPLGKDVGEQSNQALRRGRSGIEMPGAQIPLLENQ